DVPQFIYGLEAPDQARLFDQQGKLLDIYAWSTHAVGTYSRCPDVTGSFVDVASTKALPNSCGAPPAPLPPWPGQDMVNSVDALNTFAGNLSDLFYEPPPFVPQNIL